MGLSLTPTITLGDIVQAGAVVVALIGAYYGLVNQITGLKQTLDLHAKTLGEHSDRLREHESGMVDVIRDLATVMGRIEMSAERRAKSRS